MPKPSNSIHASAGVIIAILANTWATRIIPPFIWGLIWCTRLAVLPGGPPRRLGQATWELYAAEYARAVAGSLLLSLTIGSLKALFRYLVLG
jgi:hypothetical protein